MSTSVATYSRVWFIPVSKGPLDPTNAVSRWLDYHMLHEEYGRYGNLSLIAYRPIETVSSVAHSFTINIGNALQLDSVYVTLNGQSVDFNLPLTLHPGDELAVTILWHAQETIVEDYVVFVHLLDASGHLISQHNGVPLGGTRPTSSWIPGEMLLDRHVLTIGNNVVSVEAQLITGLYDPNTLARIPFADGTTPPLSNAHFADGGHNLSQA